MPIESKPPKNFTGTTMMEEGFAWRLKTASTNWIPLPSAWGANRTTR